MAVSDSGTSGHYITASTPCFKKNRANHHIPITLPNEYIISSTHIAILPQTNLPDAARRAHIFPHLTKPLISIGTLCNNKCITVFDTNQVTIYDIDTHQPVMTGQCNLVTTLYIINMTATPTIMTSPPLPDSFFAYHVYETKLNKTSYFFIILFASTHPK